MFVIQKITHIEYQRKKERKKKNEKLKRKTATMHVCVIQPTTHK